MKILVNGARGRMGRMVIEAASRHPEVEIAGIVERPDHPEAGTTIDTPSGPLRLLGSPEGDLPEADAAIDFSMPDSTVAFASAMAERGIPVLCGTTGLSTAQRARLRELSARTAVLAAANTSLGVFCLNRLALLARELLGPSYDVEIVEVHHRHKKDAPSGTALALAQGLAATGLDPVVRGGEGSGPRREGELGISAVRGGEVVGDHTILFLGDNDRIEITHRASNRMLLAEGAIDLARRLAGRGPGWYAVEDLFE